MTARTVTAFAPATVANVAVGFDVLGFAVDAVGDRVSVTEDPGSAGVTVDAIRGVVTDLPTDPQANTASVALLSLIERRDVQHGFRISIEKGIPLGSGMGGSAASAVAAVVAADHLLGGGHALEELLRHAAAGERAASGFGHADNAAPCLYGGLTAIVGTDPFDVIRLPVPQEIVCVLVHPHMQIETRQARDVLPSTIGLGEHTDQSMKLAGFVAGCFRGDLGLIGRSLEDRIVGPARCRLIPGFDPARQAALDAGALGFAIAGSGPSVFAWTDSAPTAQAVQSAVRRAFDDAGLRTDAWSGPIRQRGAAVESGP